MWASALWMGLVGLSFSFAPLETATGLGLADGTGGEALGLVQALLGREADGALTLLPGWIVAGGFAVLAVVFWRLLLGRGPMLNPGPGPLDTPKG